MDSFTLSSNGANDLTCNNITSDNISVISSLTISSVNILSSLGNINTNINNINNDINNINSSIGSTSSSLNITGATNINFNVNNNLFTKINQSGLSIFHEGNSTTFPYTYEGWYNISNRLDSLYQCMNDSPESIINFDATHNTVIRIREQDIVNQVYYPRQFQIQTYQGASISKFDVQGLQVLDTNNNWYYINKLFTFTNNSILLCSNNVKVDNEGQLNVQNVVTNYVLGIATGTTGTWFSVKNSIMNSISGVTSLSTRCDNLLENLTTISGNAASIANIANYYSGLQSSIAVTNGVVSTAGLILAFDLKQDRFDVKAPLNLRNPNTPAITTHEYFKQLELKFNTTLLLDTGVLTINTREFLCPTYGDLGMAPTPTANIPTSSSPSYVILKNISQPMTCMSSLNVSGYTTLNNNATCMSNLNVNGDFYCTSINSTTINNLTVNVSKRMTIGDDIYNFSDSSLEVNKNITVRNNITDGSIIVLEVGTDYNGAYILMEEGKDITISTPDNSVSQAMINLKSNKAVNVNSALNITGRTIIGTDIYNYSDSILEVNKNFSIRKDITNNSRIDFKVGLGYNASYISIEEGFDINISTPNNALSQSIIALSSNKHINLAAPTTYTKDINADGVITASSLITNGIVSGTNIGVKSPIIFTTNRNININGTTFSCYDINISKYTKSIVLDGYNTRQFRMRTWLSDGDVQNLNMNIIRADIYMTNRGGLNIFALCAPLPNDNLNSTDIYLNHFLYRDTFNNIIYCSRYGSKKVYCIFEDLL